MSHRRRLFIFKTQLLLSKETVGLRRGVASETAIYQLDYEVDKGKFIRG